jgi:hypothetical protein
MVFLAGICKKDMLARELFLVLSTPDDRIVEISLFAINELGLPELDRQSRKEAQDDLCDDGGILGGIKNLNNYKV